MYLASATVSHPLREDADGVIRVGDTRVTLQTVVAAWLQGAGAEEIALRYPTLALEEVYGTLSYYLSHRESLQAYLAEEEAASAAARWDSEQRPAVVAIRARLQARRTAG
jgi:uncharacterized protein (DUF433 family)